MPFVLSTAFVKPGKTERLREWYAELESRRAEAFETLDNEGIRQEAAFIIPSSRGDMLAVFIEVDDMEAANAAFFSSPFEIDRQHREVMDDATEGGAEGRVYAELMYAFQNPPKPAQTPT